MPGQKFTQLWAKMFPGSRPTTYCDGPSYGKQIAAEYIVRAYDAAGVTFAEIEKELRSM